MSKHFFIKQTGAATLVVALILLLAVTLIAFSGVKVGVTEQRMSANDQRAKAAFEVAEAGIENGIAYLRANKSVVNSAAANGWNSPPSVPATPRWTPCAAGETALPCGDGQVNRYNPASPAPGGWQRYTPPDNNYLRTFAGYTNQIHFLSRNIGPPAAPAAFGVCPLSLGPVIDPAGDPARNIDLFRLLGLTSIAGLAVNLVNLALGGLSGGGLGISPLCLPLFFAPQPDSPVPSRENPAITIISSVIPDDQLGARAQARQIVPTSSLLARQVPGALLVNGIVNLNGDIRIWGNPSPPTAFALLQPPLLGGINVTMPLSIWASGEVMLAAAPFNLLNPAALLNGARTCVGLFNYSNQFCTPLSITVAPIVLPVPLPLLPALGASAAGVSLKLTDIREGGAGNLGQFVGGTLAQVVGAVVPPPVFPTDLFLYTFGVPNAQSDTIKENAILLTDCTTLNAQSTGLYWVEGDCIINTDVGTISAPVVLVVENGNLTFQTNDELFGLVYFKNIATVTVRGVGSAVIRSTIYGAIVSDNNLNGRDQFSLVHSVEALRRAGFRAGSFVKLPGSWLDRIDIQAAP